MNIHEADRGRRVRTLNTKHRRFPAAGFPGWGKPGAAESLLPTPPGLEGTVTDVESHGSNPYTRYEVRFDDGTHTSGLVHGQDFEFADGQPQRRSTP